MTRQDGGDAAAVRDPEAVRLPDLVIFDLDGTLADTVPDIAWSLNATLAEAGLPALPIETVKQHVGDGAAKLIERSLPAVGATSSGPARPDPAALLPRFLAHYAGHLCVDSRLYPGIAALLGAIGRARIAAAVVTNKPGTLARPLLDGLAPAGTFTAIIGDGDGFPRKPDPAAARSIIARLGPRTRAVVIGDGVPDMRMARALGARAIAAAWGYVSRDRLQAEIPDAVAATPDDVAGLIGLV